MWLEFLLYGVLPVTGINVLGYVLGYTLQTDKFTDISYSLSFMAAVLCGFFLGGLGGWPALLYLLIVCFWAVRLGAFLFYRIHQMGRDMRFDEMRGDPIKFASFWVLQAITVCIIILPFFFIANDASFKVSSYIFLALAALSVVMEWTADLQKLKSKVKRNAKPWEVGGMWKRIRHPNYSFEIAFWVFVFLYAFSLCAPFWTFLSPLWITFLLVAVSGIPLIEKSRKERYGDQQEYRDYLNKSSRLFPIIY